MIESPLMKEFAEQIEHQTRRTDIEDLIRGRFGTLSDDARARLEGLKDPAKLRALLLFAGLCPTLEAFLERLAKETAPAPAPQRGAHRHAARHGGEGLLHHLSRVPCAQAAGEEGARLRIHLGQHPPAQAHGERHR